MAHAQTKPHPWNRSFRWEPARPPYRCITPEQADAWNERGVFVLEDAFEAATLRALVDAIDPVEQQVTRYLHTRPGGRLFIADARTITFCTHLVTRLPVARAFCAAPLFQALCHDLLGSDVRLYWDQAVYKKPASSEGFPWHQDNGYTYVEPQQYLTCWVALTDATLANGCPWVAPGRHRQGTLAHWMTDRGWQCLEDPEDVVAVPVRAGSVVVFSSLTPHRTGPNHSQAERKAYIVQFAPNGAVALQQDASSGRVLRLAQDHPERQFPILRRGVPVAPDQAAPRV